MSARLFTPGGRLGWTFVDRRRLIGRFPEPEPDPELIRRQAARRVADAQKSYQWCRKWIARPSLMLGVLVGCVKALHPATPLAGVVVAVIVVSGPGLAWTGWRWRQQRHAQAADPDELFDEARFNWEERAAAHQEAGLASVAGLPAWESALPSARRTDVYGGTLAGWQSLLTVHGASILAGQPLLVADLSGQLPSGQLAALARQAGLPTATYLLPGDLGRSGLLARLTPAQFGDALTEAIHAGGPADRTDRAVDVRVLEQLTAALEPRGVTPARLAAAVQAALGHPVPPALLTPPELELIQGTLFPDGFRAQIAPNLIRLDAFLSDLARHAGIGPQNAPPAAYCTCMAVQAGARSARTEMLTALIIQWLTIQVSVSSATTPAVIVAAADEVTRMHAERLAGACERRGVPLTLLYRHLRDDAALGMIGGGATAFMRLGNHVEAEAAAAFIGREHSFVLSGFTVSSGGSQSRGRNRSQSWGTASSRGSSVSRGWGEDGSTSGGRTRSREFSSNSGGTAGESSDEGVSWNDAVAMERVYDYAVEPGVLQNLPEHALLLVTRRALRAVECHPSIVTLPGAGAEPVAGEGRPRLAPRNVSPAGARRDPRYLRRPLSCAKRGRKTPRNGTR